MKRAEDVGLKRKGTPHIVFWDSVRCREDSTESVNNQPSAQEEVKKLAKGPGMKTGGLASKGYGKAFLNSKR
jgi:hypothetical protein